MAKCIESSNLLGNLLEGLAASGLLGLITLEGVGGIFPGGGHCVLFQLVVLTTGFW